jgi:hypothetical protein
MSWPRAPTAEARAFLAGLGFDEFLTDHLVYCSHDPGQKAHEICIEISEPNIDDDEFDILNIVTAAQISELAGTHNKYTQTAQNGKINCHYEWHDAPNGTYTLTSWRNEYTSYFSITFIEA